MSPRPALASLACLGLAVGACGAHAPASTSWRAVDLPTAGPPVGPFSAATESGDLVFASAQGGEDPATGALAGASTPVQAEQALRNLRAVLRAAGCDLGDAIKVNVYLTDVADFRAFNAAYARFFSPPYPARTTVAMSALPLGARVEIDLVARKKAPR
jgi:2-iminobutanoate/2-iminopropanoate deaminase